MSELLKISQKLTKAANRWPLSDDRRLDLLRVAKRIRIDGMDERNIELLIIAAAAAGCRTVDDYAEETGLSRKEAGDLLHQLWQRGTLDKAEDRLHDRGRPRIAYLLAGEFFSKEKNPFEKDVDSLS